MILAETSTQNKLSTARSRWYLPVAIFLSLIFLYLAIRGVSWDEFVSTVINCHIEYLIPAILISLVNFFVRSQRWGILVRASKPVPPLTMFWSTGIGYLGNNFLPFRSGEIIRSVALGQKAGISKVFVFATALTERVIDAIFLILLALVLIPTIGKVPSWLPPAMRGLGILSFIAIVVLLMAPRLENVLHSLLNRVPLPTKWRPFVRQMLEQFLQGAATFQNLGRAMLFLLMTGLIWLLDGLGMMISARAFSIGIHLSQSLLLLVGLGLSSAIPSTPGYVGVYQFIAITILAIYGFPKSQSLAFILVAQVIGMLLTLIWGLVGFGILGFHFDGFESERTNPVESKGHLPDD
jgi:uncharacterized protein (TIRG00374 family)